MPSTVKGFVLLGAAVILELVLAIAAVRGFLARSWGFGIIMLVLAMALAGATYYLVFIRPKRLDDL